MAYAAVQQLLVGAIADAALINCGYGWNVVYAQLRYAPLVWWCLCPLARLFMLVYV